MKPFLATWRIRCSTTNSMGGLAEPLGNHDRVMAPHSCYPCAPSPSPASGEAGADNWIVICVETDGQWQRLSSLIGRDEWATMDREERHRNQGLLDGVIAEWTRPQE